MRGLQEWSSGPVNMGTLTCASFKDLLAVKSQTLVDTGCSTTNLCLHYCHGLQAASMMPYTQGEQAAQYFQTDRQMS